MTPPEPESKKERFANLVRPFYDTNSGYVMGWLVG